MIRRLLLAVALSLAGFATPAAAEVTLSFYSFNGAFGGRFPHAFVRWQGTTADGTPVDGNAGFTARTISPAILLGSVRHTIWVEEPKYMDEANRHFELVIDDATFARVLAEVETWRNLPGDAYNLNRRNCVHFVADMARLVGLNADDPGALKKKPKAYLNHLIELNPQLGATPVAWWTGGALGAGGSVRALASADA